MNTKSTQLIQLSGYRRKKFWKPKLQRTLEMIAYPCFIIGIFLISVLTLVGIMLIDFLARQAYLLMQNHRMMAVYISATVLGILLQWSKVWHDRRNRRNAIHSQGLGKHRVRLAVIER